jgi:hypothetical protein
MKNLAVQIAASLPSKIRLVMFVITLALFVIGAGAPDSGGGFVR